MGEFLKIIEIENSKRKKISVKESKKIKVEEKKVIEEVEVQVETIRKEKKEKKFKAKEIEENKPKVILKVGDRVRMNDGKAVGTIDKIEKTKAIVNYGVFTSKISLTQLEFVQPK
jgi:DNA mismatch repair protein MutS2